MACATPSTPTSTEAERWTPQPQNHLVEVRNLSVRFKLDDAVVEAVENVSFHVDRGETLALVGESGAGKSVTARAIMKLLPRTATVSPREPVMLDGTRIDQFSERQMLGGARQPHLDDLPGADVVAQPDLPDRQPDRRGHHPAPGPDQEAGAARRRSTC